MRKMGSGRPASWCIIRRRFMSEEALTIMGGAFSGADLRLCFLGCASCRTHMVTTFRHSTEQRTMHRTASYLPRTVSKVFYARPREAPGCWATAKDRAVTDSTEYSVRSGQDGQGTDGGNTPGSATHPRPCRQSRGPPCPRAAHFRDPPLAGRLCPLALCSRLCCHRASSQSPCSARCVIKACQQTPTFSSYHAARYGSAVAAFPAVLGLAARRTTHV